MYSDTFTGQQYEKNCEFIKSLASPERNMLRTHVTYLGNVCGVQHTTTRGSTF